MSTRESVQIPDDRDFNNFRTECNSDAGWSQTYNKSGIVVWIQILEVERSLHKIKNKPSVLDTKGLAGSVVFGEFQAITCGIKASDHEGLPQVYQRVKPRLMECKDIAAETLYDVLHDIEYRKKWDTNVIETFDIGKLTVNSDVGYYAWKCPKPLKNRDVITLRSWLPMGADYIIMNYSVKHPKYPPRKDMVRAVSIQTGYLIQGRGVKSCSITYLAQVDPKGSLPKWVVNKSSQFLAPKAMKKMYKACLKYPDWKQKHNPHFKPWLFPEQSTLPTVALSELSIQHADSLENIDESSLSETKDDRGEGSDEDSVN